MTTRRGDLIVIGQRSGKVLARRKVGRGATNAEVPAVAVDLHAHRVFGTDPVGRRLWVVSPNRLIGSVTFPDHTHLEDLAVDGVHHIVYLATSRPAGDSSVGSLVGVDTRTLAVESSIELGSYPYRVAVDPHRYRVYLTDQVKKMLWIVSEDTVPADSSFTTPDGAVLAQGDPVTGNASDDFSGVRRVRVTYDGPDGSGVAQTTPTCNNSERLSCTWEAVLPDTPGSYQATCEARDRAGNWETDGPTITVVRGP